MRALILFLSTTVLLSSMAYAGPVEDFFADFEVTGDEQTDCSRHETQEDKETCHAMVEATDRAIQRIEGDASKSRKQMRIRLKALKRVEDWHKQSWEEEQ